VDILSEEEIIEANNLDLSDIDDTQYKEMYVAALMLMSEDSSVEMAHYAVLAMLDKVEIDFTPMTSERYH